MICITYIRIYEDDDKLWLVCNVSYETLPELGETFLSLTLTFSLSEMFCIIPCPKWGHFHYIKQKRQRKEKRGVCCFVPQMKLQANKKLLKDFQPSWICLWLSAHLSIDPDCSPTQILVWKSRKWEKISCWFGLDGTGTLVQLGHAAVLTTASSLEDCWYKPRLATKEE